MQSGYNDLSSGSLTGLVTACDGDRGDLVESYKFSDVGLAGCFVDTANVGYFSIRFRVEDPGDPER